MQDWIYNNARLKKKLPNEDKANDNNFEKLFFSRMET